MEDEKKSERWARLVPINVFSHPAFTVRDRVLLLTMSFAKDDVCDLNTNMVCKIIGLVGEDGEPTEADIVAVRQARASLTAGKARKGNVDGGFIEHVTLPRKRGEPRRDAWKVRSFACAPGSVAALNALASKEFRYVDRHAGSKFVTSKTVTSVSEAAADTRSIDELLYGGAE